MAKKFDKWAGAREARNCHNPRPFGPNSSIQARITATENAAKSISQQIVSGLIELGYEARVIVAEGTPRRVRVHVTVEGLDRLNREVCDIVRAAIERGRSPLDRKVGHVVALNGHQAWTMSSAA